MAPPRADLLVGVPAPPPMTLTGRRILTQTSAILAIRGAITASRVLLLFIIAAPLPPAAFGVIAFAVGAAELAKAVSDFGLDTVAVRWWARAEVGEDTRLAVALVPLRVATAIVAYGLLVAGLAVTSDARAARAGAAAGLIVFTGAMTNASLAFLQVRGDLAAAAPRVLGAAAVGTVLVLASLRWLSGPAGLALAVPAVELLPAAALVARVGREVPLTVVPPGRAAWRLLRESAPVAATLILVNVYSRLDLLFLQALATPAAVGFYGVAARVVEPFQLVAAVLATTVYGYASRTLPEAHPDTFREFTARYVLGACAYGVAIGSVIALAAPVFFTEVMPRYAGAIVPVQILGGALVFRSVNGVLTGLIHACGRFVWITGVAIANLVTMVVLLAVLVTRFGPAGAAAAVLGAEAANTAIQGALLLRLSGRGMRLPAGSLA